jgi:DNA-binding MarR family transcriptional regulator
MKMTNTTATVTGAPTVKGDAGTSDDAALDRVMSAFRVLQLHHSRALRRESAAHGMNPTDLRFLFFLSANDGATSKQAGEYLELSTGAMTSVIDRVEQHGHMERRPNPADRRSALLYLTPSGVQIASEIGAVYRSAFRDAVASEHLVPLARIFEHVGSALG